MSFKIKPLRFYTTLEGRVNRKQFWLDYFVPVVLLVIIEAVLSGALGDIVSLFFLPLWIALMWVGICICAKRLHDHGKSGWWQLVYLVPLLGAIWALIEQGFLPGQPGENQYGPPVE